MKQTKNEKMNTLKIDNQSFLQKQLITQIKNTQNTKVN